MISEISWSMCPSSDKFWFWRLAPNHKALHYGDCGESEVLALEHLPNKRKFRNIEKFIVMTWTFY